MLHGRCVGLCCWHHNFHWAGLWMAQALSVFPLSSSLTTTSSSKTFSPSLIFCSSVCSYSCEGSPMKRPFTTDVCTTISSVAGGRRLHSMQFRLPTTSPGSWFPSFLPWPLLLRDKAQDALLGLTPLPFEILRAYGVPHLHM